MGVGIEVKMGRRKWSAGVAMRCECGEYGRSTHQCMCLLDVRHVDDRDLDLLGRAALLLLAVPGAADRVPPRIMLHPHKIIDHQSEIVESQLR